MRLPSMKMCLRRIYAVIEFDNNANDLFKIIFKGGSYLIAMAGI
jgi:hypothetical protein